jgi:hypothetical protein
MLEARHFTIFTDHKPITFAFQQKRDKCSSLQFNHLDYKPTADISLDKTTSSPTLSLASNLSLRSRHTTYSLQHRTPTMNFEHSWHQTPPYG